MVPAVYTGAPLKDLQSRDGTQVKVNSSEFKADGGEFKNDGTVSEIADSEVERRRRLRSVITSVSTPVNGERVWS